MKLRYSPEARNDISSLHSYIAKDLKNPIAAKNVVSRLLNSCSMLKDHPYIGADLSAMTGRDTDLRYIISGNHFVFYRVEETYISVTRILDGRTNYMQVLFRHETTD